MSSSAGLTWTVLGAGTAVAHLERSPSGHLLTSSGGSVLLDMGAGTLPRLLRAGVSWQQLDAICLSHRHLDHFLDLPALLFASRIPGHGRTAPLPIHMGPGMRDWVEGFASLLGRWFEPRGFTIAWHEHCTNPQESRADHFAEIAGLRATFARVAHDKTSIGMRFEAANGAVIAYSGDSDQCDNLLELCRGADLAVLECSSDIDAKIPGHLTPKEVAQIALEAQVGAVALVHMYPELDGVDLVARTAACGYHGPLFVARDGQRFTVRPGSVVTQ